MIPEPDTSPAFFESLYQAAVDPWDFGTNAYEQARYAAMEARLGNRRFHAVFEPACSIGAFTQRLAARCDRVDACDAAPTAVQRARQRCAKLANVNISCAKLPDELPDTTYDLIVFAECGYYFPPELLRDLSSALCDRLRPNGVLLGCHWLGHSVDHWMNGERVHRIMSEEIRWLRDASEQDTTQQYVLDCWRRSAWLG